ncbi:IDEAL domain-containing protein [Metabacillus litoralis]|uniref:IDEAL domain-containing protein n=1 Tax=Metabacillus litoralis TaxID=152268 RepID=UPI00203D1F8F|nr:IDEAL domain-containing protein [Metabacillus litoralis]MCM3651310.1 IDEAL domain-containing protein [Metabacillus litoralis]
MFQLSEWVKDDSGRLGYITGVHIDNQITARFIRSAAGYEMNSTAVKQSTEVKHAPLETTPSEDDLYFLINLSLDTNDEEWFKELTSKLPV